MKRILFSTYLVLISCVCSWAGGPDVATQFDDIQGVVSIAKGGTGATTAAGARSALGLPNHEQITVAATGGVTLAGFVRLGDASTGLKCKLLTGTCGANQGDAVTVAHGLTGDKIIGWTAKVAYGSNLGVGPGYPGGTLFYCYHDATNFMVVNVSGDSGSILSDPFSILVWYTE